MEKWYAVSVAMIMLGVFLVMCVTIKRMVSMDFISDRTTLKAMHSDVLRTGRDAESIYKCGENTPWVVLVIHVLQDCIMGWQVILWSE